MSWPLERKREACLRAPMCGELVRADTRIVSRPDWFQLLTPSAPGSVLNEVILSQVSEADADRVIEETIAQYRAIAHPTKWSVGDWTRPADFGERLARRGFSSWDVRGMGLETDRGPPAPAGVEVEQVSESTLSAFLEAERQGWALPASDAGGQRAMYLAALGARPQRVHLFVARANGAVVGTAGVVPRGEYAYLLGTQVLAAARGKGAYRALISARLAFLRERGVGYAVTQAREATSAPILERVGFETLFRSKCFLHA